jgi:hypothetical protein
MLPNLTEREQPKPPDNQNEESSMPQDTPTHAAQGMKPFLLNKTSLLINPGRWSKFAVDKLDKRRQTSDKISAKCVEKESFG